MTETTLAELERRGELEIGERVSLGDGYAVQRFDHVRSDCHGLYFATNPSERYLHSDGQWHGATGTVLGGTRDTFTGYFDDLPTLLDRLAATLYAEADATSGPRTTETGGQA